jgi:membrane complex biogenesis BtpA family protein
MRSFLRLFSGKKALIACLHLPALPGSPRYEGSMTSVYEQTLAEVELLKRFSVDAVLVENFRDNPFYPDRLPPETIASMTALTREVVRSLSCPVGVNALRNDGLAAIAIATAANAHFVRINVHMNAVVADQGIIEGRSYETLRLRKNLQSDVLIAVDVGVKHASALGNRGMGLEAKDATERGMADALILSGVATGAPVSVEDFETVRNATPLPLFLGSGCTLDSLEFWFSRMEALIVGSFLKKEGKAENGLEEDRLRIFTQKFQALREKNEKT